MTETRVTVYEDEAGEWRWRLRIGNSDIFASSNEAFDSKFNAVRAGARVLAIIDTGNEEVLETLSADGILEVQEAPETPEIGQGMTLSHPARYSSTVLEASRKVLDEWRQEGDVRVLDPFAGLGGIHTLADPGVETVGVEIEPEWAGVHEDTWIGDATGLVFASRTFDAVVTSPCFANRMADKYDGRGICKRCSGQGRIGIEDGALIVDTECPRCKGVGRDRSRRITYRLSLGRMPHDNSAATMQWGEKYRALHRAAIAEMVRVVRPGGLVLINMSNHIRKGVEVDVVGWWEFVLVEAGLEHRETIWVHTPRMRFGAHHELRVDGERLIVCTVPE